MEKHHCSSCRSLNTYESRKLVILVVRKLRSLNKRFLGPIIEVRISIFQLAESLEKEKEKTLV